MARVSITVALNPLSRSREPRPCLMSRSRFSIGPPSSSLSNYVRSSIAVREKSVPAAFPAVSVSILSLTKVLIDSSQSDRRLASIHLNMRKKRGLRVIRGEFAF